MYSIVLGLQFGDEGKGSMVANLCKQSKNPLVIRFNGGHQAGHTVLHDGIRHTFSSFGSGTLQGAPTYWSKYCTFFPTACNKEYKIIKEKFGIKPILMVDPLSPVTTPFDVLANLQNTKNGSVGVGFGTTIERHESFYKLYFQDLFNKTILKAKMENIKKYYNFNTYHYNTWFGDEHYDEKLLNDWYSDIDNLINNGIISIYQSNSIYDGHYNHFIFEGAQGILLDQDFGFFPNVTRSNTTSKNALEILKGMDASEDKIAIYYMTRCYQTRHGAGFMSNENLGELDLINNENEINVNGGVQGTFRKTFLDLDLIKYAVECDTHFSDKLNKHLVITCLDQIKDEITYSINEEFHSSKIEELTNQIKSITGIKNIIHGASEGVFKDYKNNWFSKKDIYSNGYW